MKIECPKCGYKWYPDVPHLLGYICLKCGVVYSTEKKRDECKCHSINIEGKSIDLLEEPQSIQKQLNL